MAISETSSDGQVTLSHVGRVVRIDRMVKRRNHSDTLDYSDWQATDCTFALVWLGEHGFAPDSYDGLPHVRTRDNSLDGSGAARALDPWEQFAYVDCTNLFVWRGDARVTAVVDLDIVNDPRLDPKAWMALTIWEAKRANDAKKAAEFAAEQDRLERERRAQIEKDRPVVGKRMVVKSGRKVPIGTQGTVAFISANGGVLLKDDGAWKDRKAQGTWVDPRHLRAR
jgi:hypothetical protein